MVCIRLDIILLMRCKTESNRWAQINRSKKAFGWFDSCAICYIRRINPISVTLSPPLVLAKK